MLTLIKEDKEVKSEETSNEQKDVDSKENKIPVDNVVPMTTTPKEPKDPSTSNDVDLGPVDVNDIINGVSSSINDLVQKFWNLIFETNSVNSTITLIDAEKKVDIKKDDITNLLNSIVDDVTIDIGMLHKALELIDNKSSELLQNGETKAQEIINNK